MREAGIHHRVAVVVGDRAADGAKAQGVFEEAGYVVKLALSGPVATRFLRSNGTAAALIFIDYSVAGTLPGLDLALNLHAEFPWIHLIVSTDDPDILEEVPCACVLAQPWREIDLLVEAERAARWGSEDEIAIAEAARLVSAHALALGRHSTA